MRHAQGSYTLNPSCFVRRGFFIYNRPVPRFGGSKARQKKAKRLALEMKAELLIAENKKDKIVFYATKGFAQYWKPQGQ